MRSRCSESSATQLGAVDKHGSIAIIERLPILWPILSTGWVGFELRPFNVFERNPAVDLPE